MSGKSFYIIDSSSLIALNRLYPIDVFPTLWDNVHDLISKGLLISHKEVYKEICAGDDSLKKWAMDQKNLFKDIDEGQMRIVKEILKKYPSLAKSESEEINADPFVIALAVTLNNGPQKKLFTKGKLIVTEEKSRGNRIRIPFVCQDYKIDCIDILEMCRAEGWKF